MMPLLWPSEPVIYNSFMGSNPTGGISFHAAAPSGSKYSVNPNMGNKPVNYVDFFDAMRFVNCPENGQIPGGTETGVYTISDGLSETRTPGAQFFIPTLNEWYNAAYYDPTAGAGGGDNYWLYPTQSDSIPTVATANAVGDISNPGPNVVNYLLDADWNGLDGNVTTVASAGPDSASFYGTFDQGGNVWEWNEAVYPLSTRAVGGGSSASILDENLRSSKLSVTDPTNESPEIGFRVARPIPEPASIALAATGGLFVFRCRQCESVSAGETTASE
jgi:hypothetical protein